jgi:hypothetical protein
LAPRGAQAAEAPEPDKRAMNIEPRILVIVVIMVAAILAAAWAGRFAGFW